MTVSVTVTMTLSVTVTMTLGVFCYRARPHVHGE